MVLAGTHTHTLASDESKTQNRISFARALVQSSTILCEYVECVCGFLESPHHTFVAVSSTHLISSKVFISF